jgi:hypothetical protein
MGPPRCFPRSTSPRAPLSPNATPAIAPEAAVPRGIYRSVVALRADILSIIEAHKADPKPPSAGPNPPTPSLARIERFCGYNQPATA